MTEKYIANTRPSPPDQRDIPYVPKILPHQYASSIDLMPNVYEVEDQGSIGSCVANGVASQCEWLAKLAGAPQDLSRLFLYTATLEFEDRTGEEGLAPRDAYSVAHKYGICAEAAYPYDISKAGVNPPESAYQAANATKMRRYESVVSNTRIQQVYEPEDRINIVMAALNEGMPVGIAMTVTDSISHMKGPWQTQDYTGFAASGAQSIGGHYVVIIGYDDSVGRFLVQNSWGTAWGDGGFGGFPYSIVSEPFFEAWLVRDFNGYQVQEAPGIYLEGQNKYIVNARITVPEALYGTTTNIWMGAKDLQGNLYLRAPIPLDAADGSRTDMSGGLDRWGRYDGVNTPPCLVGYTLTASNKINVVNWMNLESLGGGILYLAYGNSPLDWTLGELGTLKRY